MGFCLRFIVALHALTALTVFGLLWAVLNGHLPPVPETPEIEAKWFGKGQRTKEDTAVRPFKVNVDDKVSNRRDNQSKGKAKVAAGFQE